VFHADGEKVMRDKSLAERSFNMVIGAVKGGGRRLLAHGRGVCPFAFPRPLGGERYLEDTLKRGASTTFLLRAGVVAVYCAS